MLKMASNTAREIKLAITRIRHGRQKRISADRRFSIAAVAAEAGISNATIHNRYPDLADHIRKLQNDELKSRFDAPEK
jgi:AcrR family transcriptional regulator